MKCRPCTCEDKNCYIQQYYNDRPKHGDPWLQIMVIMTILLTLISLVS